VAKDTIEDRIARRVVEMLDQRDPNIRQRLMTLKQAATYLGMTQNALRAKAAIGRIPTVAIDRNTRFDVRELDKLIERTKRGGDL
jgi:hypothetical protein